MSEWHDVRFREGAKILAWAAAQPWAQAMAACEQDSGWHAEGDVWTHTQMVVNQLERLSEWPLLDPSERTKLTFAALFHDAGKPATTQIDPDTGRTRSPRHSLVSTEIARAVLRELGCDLQTREQISNLVRYHGRPAHLLEKPDPSRELISLSWLLNNRLLYLLALADTRGRATLDTSRAEEHVGLWRLIAEENGCFDQPFPFANDHARYLYYAGTLSSLHYVPHQPRHGTITMMSGLPASGKDTWLRTQRAELPVVSLDAIRSDLDVAPTDDQGGVVQLARERCREHLRAGQNFAFNATNLIRQTRRQWIELFVAYGARVEVVYLEPPLRVLRERNANRKLPVPKRVIDRLVSKLEPPTLTEAHSLTLIGDLD